MNFAKYREQLSTEKSTRVSTSISTSMSTPSLLDLDGSQRERTPLTGHVLLPSNRYKKPTNRNKLGD